MKTLNLRTYSRKLVLIGLMAFQILSFTACQDDENDQATIDGIYVINEGYFQANNASITLINPDNQETVQNYFYDVNNYSLGDIAQDLSFHGEKGYIIVNNSHKMEIIDKESFESLAVIENLSYPRQFIGIDDSKGYISDGTSATGENAHLLVVDLNEYTITDSIEVGKGPESMLKKDNRVFVANMGGFSTGNTVSVIDSDQDTTLKTIEVAKKPADLVEDANGNIWVYCKGALDLNTYKYDARLIKINPENYETETYPIGEMGSYGNYLMDISPDLQSIYYVGTEGVYEMDVNAASLPDSPVINMIPYGVDVNPETGNIFCVASGQSSGYAIRYGSDHTLMDSTRVGISPNAVVFE